MRIRSLSAKIIAIRIVVVLGFSLILLICTPSRVLATNTGQFTAELWVKPATSVASKAILGKSEELRIFTDASGYVGCQIKATTWQTAATATTNALTLNTFSHVACSYDKANIKVYVNGTQVATQAETDAPDDTAAAFEIGEDDSASTTYTNFIGTVDNFQFYNYARTPGQILADMGTGLAQKEPIGYWRLDEGYGQTANNSGNGSTALNGTLGANSGSSTDDPTWTNSGKFGKALDFEADSDQYITVTSATGSPIRFAGSMTISTWIKAESLPSNDYRRRILSTFDGSSDGDDSGVYSFDLVDSSGFPRFFFYNSSDTIQLLTSSTALSTGTWYHLLATYDEPSTTIKLYINGRLDKTGTTTGTRPATNNNLAIGWDLGSQVQGYELDGLIDELKIYNYALTADEVKEEYNRGESMQLGALGSNTSYAPQATNQIYCVPGDTTSCAAPVGEWNFDEGKGTSVKDTSGNNNTGTWSGGSTIRYTPGKIGSAGKFNGSDDYINITDNGTMDFGTGDFSIEAWIKPMNTSYMRLLNKLNTTPGNQLGFLVDINAGTGGVLDEGNLRFKMVDANNTTVDYNYEANITGGVWKHVAVTIDRDSTTGLKLYANGVQIGTSQNPTTAAASVSNDDSFGIGTLTDALGDYYNGSIDQVRIYNYARSAAQIAWDYNQGKPVGHWKFDECQGSVANDSSGNKNNGTITIGASGEDTLGTCTTSSTAWGSGATGKYNSSLSFDGTDDYVSISDQAYLTPTSNGFSVTGWVKYSAFENNGSQVRGPIAEKDPYSGTGSWEWVFGAYNFSGTTNPTFQFLTTTAAGGTLSQANSNIVASIGTWYHVVGTVDNNGAARIYINGKLLATGDNASFPSNTSENVIIGAGYGSGNRWDTNGQIDDVKIFNYALTATQVKTLFNNGAVFFGPNAGSP